MASIARNCPRGQILTVNYSVNVSVRQYSWLTNTNIIQLHNIKWLLMTEGFLTCCFSAYKVKSIFEFFMLDTQIGWWVYYKLKTTELYSLTILHWLMNIQWASKADLEKEAQYLQTTEFERHNSFCNLKIHVIQF